MAGSISGEWGTITAKRGTLQLLELHQGKSGIAAAVFSSANRDICEVNGFFKVTVAGLSNDEVKRYLCTVERCVLGRNVSNASSGTQKSCGLHAMNIMRQLT